MATSDSLFHTSSVQFYKAEVKSQADGGNLNTCIYSQRCCGIQQRVCNEWENTMKCKFLLINNSRWFLDLLYMYVPGYHQWTYHVIKFIRTLRFKHFMSCTSPWSERVYPFCTINYLRILMVWFSWLHGMSLPPNYTQICISYETCTT